MFIVDAFELVQICEGNKTVAVIAQVCLRKSVSIHPLDTLALFPTGEEFTQYLKTMNWFALPYVTLQVSTQLWSNSNISDSSGSAYTK